MVGVGFIQSQERLKKGSRLEKHEASENYEGITKGDEMTAKRDAE